MSDRTSDRTSDTESDAIQCHYTSYRTVDMNTEISTITIGVLIQSHNVNT